MSKIQIAIDGPASAGKSTVAKIIAKDLNFVYCDTGAMYRAVTFAGLQARVSLTDSAALIALLAQTPLSFQPSATGQKVFLGHQEVTEEIRSQAVNQEVSGVSALKEVREKLVELQQEIAASQNIVMDGRDIGTQVLPQAQVKIFLIASVAERAKRRYQENLSKGQTADLAEIAESIAKRDYLDSHRAVSPLKKAADAVEVDTTGLNIQEVVDTIKKIISSKVPDLQFL